MVERRPSVLLLLLDERDYPSNARAIARALVSASVRVTVMVGRYASLPDDEGVEFVEWRLARGGMNPLREVSSFLQVLDVYRALRPSLVHHFAHKPTCYGGIAAALLGVPAVSTVLGLGYAFWSERWQAQVVRRAICSTYRRVLRRASSRSHDRLPEDSKGLLVHRHADIPAPQLPELDDSRRGLRLLRNESGPA